LWNMNYYPAGNSGIGLGYGIGYDYQNPTAIQTSVKTFFCPSRRGPETPPIWSDPAQGARGALGDYAANIGTTGYDIYDDRYGSLFPNGPFRLGDQGRGVRLAEITDGLSNTILIGEKHVQKDQ